MSVAKEYGKSIDELDAKDIKEMFDERQFNHVFELLKRDNSGDDALSANALKRIWTEAEKMPHTIVRKDIMQGIRHQKKEYYPEIKFGKPEPLSLKKVTKGAGQVAKEAAKEVDKLSEKAVKASNEFMDGPPPKRFYKRAARTGMRALRCSVEVAAKLAVKYTDKAAEQVPQVKKRVKRQWRKPIFKAAVAAVPVAATLIFITGGLATTVAGMGLAACAVPPVARAITGEPLRKSLGGLFGKVKELFDKAKKQVDSLGLDDDDRDIDVEARTKNSVASMVKDSNAKARRESLRVTKSQVKEAAANSIKSKGKAIEFKEMKDIISNIIRRLRSEIINTNDRDCHDTMEEIRDGLKVEMHRVRALEKVLEEDRDGLGSARLDEKKAILGNSKYEVGKKMLTSRAEYIAEFAATVERAQECLENLGGDFAPYVKKLNDFVPTFTAMVDKVESQLAHHGIESAINGVTQRTLEGEVKIGDELPASLRRVTTGEGLLDDADAQIASIQSQGIKIDGNIVEKAQVTMKLREHGSPKGGGGSR